jgi:uncharacterized protein (DUF1778 family)
MPVANAKKVATANKDRLNFRLDPEIKARVVRAAAITGQEVTDFAVATLNEKASEILERHGSLTLNSEDYQFFLNALTDNRKPSKRSSDAARRYRRGKRKGVSYNFDN